MDSVLALAASESRSGKRSWAFSCRVSGFISSDFPSPFFSLLLAFFFGAAWTCSHCWEEIYLEFGDNIVGQTHQMNSISVGSKGWHWNKTFQLPLLIVSSHRFDDQHSLSDIDLAVDLGAPCRSHQGAAYCQLPKTWPSSEVHQAWATHPLGRSKPGVALGQHPSFPSKSKILKSDPFSWRCCRFGRKTMLPEAAYGTDM